MAGLDWTVEKHPVQYVNPVNGRTQRLASRFATVRSDTGAALGCVGGNYVPMQNGVCFEVCDDLVGTGDVRYESAGALKDGRKVWMLARLPQDTQAADGDTIKNYLLLVNSHDGSKSMEVLLTSVRVVCNNTLTQALRIAGKRGAFRVRHNGTAASKVVAMREALGLAAQQVEQQEQEAQQLVERKMTSDEARRYFLSLFPTKDGSVLDAVLGATQERRAMSKLDAVLEATEELTNEDKRNAKVLAHVIANYDNRRNNLPGIERSAWSAYNAVSEWADHQKASRGKNDKARAENRLNSNWFGSSAKVKEKAYELALKYARN